MGRRASPGITAHRMLTSHEIEVEAQLDDNVHLGQGTIVEGDVEIKSGVQVGRYCVLQGEPGKKTVIESNTVLEDFVTVYPGVYISENSRVGAYTILGHPSKAELVGGDNTGQSERVREQLVAQPETVIGPRAIIRSHSVIYTHVQVGSSFNTGHSIMIREHTRIGNDCVFGTHASTDGYCRIGPMCHIGQYAQLSQAARIGRGVFIGGHTVFSDNNRAIRDVEEDLFGATIEDYVRIGLSCVILPTVHINAHSMIGAGSVVTRDIGEKTLAYGNPARLARELTVDEIQRYVISVESSTR